MEFILVVLVLILGMICLKNAKQIVKLKSKYTFFVFLVSGLIFYSFTQLIYLANKLLGFKTCILSYSLHSIGAVFIIGGILSLFSKHKLKHLLDPIHQSTIGFMFFSTVLYIYYLMFELNVPKPALLLPMFSGLMFLASYLLVLHHESGLLRITYKNIASGLFFMYLADMFLVYYVWVTPLYRVRIIYEILYILSFLMFSIGLLLFYKQQVKIKKKVSKKKLVKKVKKKFIKKNIVKTKVSNKKTLKQKVVRKQVGKKSKVSKGRVAKKKVVAKKRISKN